MNDNLLDFLIENAANQDLEESQWDMDFKSATDREDR